jgi:hypothetical protein
MSLSLYRVDKTITEIQVLLTGLFITGIMAGAISILGFDPRSLPVPFSLLSPDVFFFLVILVYLPNDPKTLYSSYNHSHR